MDINIYKDKAEKLKVISHPHRLCILKGLLENSCNVSKIQESLDLPQSTVSQHLSKLKAAKVVEGVRNGLEISYSVIDDDVKTIVCLLTQSNTNTSL